MPPKIKASPVLCAALGAASAFYCLIPIFRKGLISIDALLVLSFIPVAALCLFWVLASFPPVSHDRRFRMAAILAAAFSAGLALGISAGAKAATVTSFGIPENTVTGISGVLLDDPRLISGGRAMSALSLRMVTGSNGTRATARGEVTVFFPEESAGRLQEFGRGAAVFAGGNLRAGTGGFEGAYTFSAQTLHVTNPAPPLERFRTGLRLDLTRRFTASASAGGQWGALALPLLLGIRDNLDTGFTSLYRSAGCSYILALSGMHLAVFIAIISFLLKKPLGLKASAIAGVCIIAAYCFIVGPLPSIIRSALMYFLGVLAVLGMLKRDALSVLCMAFLIQSTVTPQAGFSVSFILSYLALAGILILGGMINNIFTGTIPAFLLRPVSVSLGAFIATAGVVAWFFGELRPVGILAGLVITPLTTLFMVGSIAWLCLDLAVPALSFLIGKPLSVLYWLMEKTAALASFIPGIRANPLPVLALSIAAAGLLAWFDFRCRRVKTRLEPFD